MSWAESKIQDLVWTARYQGLEGIRP